MTVLSDCGLRVGVFADCMNGKPIRLWFGGGTRVWLTTDQAWALVGELTRAVIEVRQPLTGFVEKGLA